MYSPQTDVSDKCIKYTIISKIERWWRELHERMNRYFKVFLSWLEINGRYDTYNETGR